MYEEDKTADRFVILQKWKLVSRVFPTLMISLFFDFVPQNRFNWCPLRYVSQIQIYVSQIPCHRWPLLQRDKSSLGCDLPCCHPWVTCACDICMVVGDHTNLIHVGGSIDFFQYMIKTCLSCLVFMFYDMISYCYIRKYCLINTMLSCLFWSSKIEKKSLLKICHQSRVRCTNAARTSCRWQRRETALQMDVILPATRQIYRLISWCMINIWSNNAFYM